MEWRPPFTTESKMASKDDELNKALLILFLIGAGLAIAGGVLFSPGMLFVTVTRRVFSLSLDIGQMWVFSILSSLFIFGAMFGLGFWYLENRVTTVDNNSVESTRKSNVFVDALGIAVMSYLGLSIFIVLLGLILYFGFHVRLPAIILRSLFGWPNN